MYECMIDLETMDTRPPAVVLSIGAVIFETLINEEGVLSYEIVDRFLRVPDLTPQFASLRTVSQDTLLWWQRQDPTARAEAFNPVRQDIDTVMRDLHLFVRGYDPEINHFWASPATFDFPIIESFAETFGYDVPWSYNQKYDVRTVVNEASYSAKDHDYRHLVGIAHTPVYDCEAQVDLLTAARNRIARRIMP